MISGYDLQQIKGLIPYTLKHSIYHRVMYRDGVLFATDAYTIKTLPYYLGDTPFSIEVSDLKDATSVEKNTSSIPFGISPIINGRIANTFGLSINSKQKRILKMCKKADCATFQKKEDKIEIKFKLEDTEFITLADYLGDFLNPFKLKGSSFHKMLLEPSDTFRVQEYEGSTSCVICGTVYAQYKQI